MLYTTYGKDGANKPLRVLVEEIMMKMRDGVSLYSFLVRPADKDKAPIILHRNPYVSQQPGFQGLCDDFYTSLAAGFAVMMQHCRGCGRSEGNCIPYVNERNDGLDTLEGIRALPCYNGEIYPIGSSYLSSVHLAYLGTAPHDIRGAVLAVQDDTRYNLIYRNGFFKIGLHGGWYVSMYKKNSIPVKNYVNDSFKMLPLSGFSKTVFGEKVPDFDNCLKHPDRNDPFWRTSAAGADFIDAVSKLDIPVLLITSWFDLYAGGVIDMWDRMPETLKRRSACLITPYCHGYVEVPGAASQPIRFENADINKVYSDFRLDWYTYASGRKRQPDFVPLGKLTYYSLFDATWVSVDALADGSMPMRLHLNGRSLSPVAGEPEDLTYCYNPAAPAEFKGGCSCNAGGMQVQDAPDSRYDIKSFLSSPFEKSFLVRGKSTARLFVKSDCEDTCFYIRMSLVRNHVAYGLRDDILSLAGQNPDYVPGTEAELNFSMDRIAFRILPGDRIRLDVSSSAWPFYVPHTNRKGLFSEQTSATVAHNTVVLGKSALTLFTEPQ